jgi:hypothetical protein
MVANIGISQPDYVVKRAGPEEVGDSLDSSRENSEAEGSASDSHPVSKPPDLPPAEGSVSSASKGEATRGGKEGGMEKSTSDELLQPTLQALAVLSNVSLCLPLPLSLPSSLSPPLVLLLHS